MIFDIGLLPSLLLDESLRLLFPTRVTRLVFGSVAFARCSCVVVFVIIRSYRN